MTQLRAAALLAAISLSVLAACGRTPNVVGSSPAAHVSALATTPAVLHAEAKLAPKAVTCARDNGVTLTITGTSVSVRHVSGMVMLHPVTTVKDTGACLGLTGADLAKLKADAESTITKNGFGQGSGSADFTQIINYIAQLKS